MYMPESLYITCVYVIAQHPYIVEEGSWSAELRPFLAQPLPIKPPLLHASAQFICLTTKMTTRIGGTHELYAPM